MSVTTKINLDSTNFQEFLQKNKNFCILPWIHFQSDSKAEVFACCVAERNSSFGSLHQKTISEIWNSEHFKKMRLQFLNNQIPVACKTCAIKDKRGAISNRTQSLVKYENYFNTVADTQTDGSLPIQNLQVLEIRFSNICNFKCRTCDPMQSSSWYAEGKLLKAPYEYETYTSEGIQKNIELATTSVLPHIKRIHFSGGEALVQEQHYVFLEKLLAHKRNDIELVYNTNLSILKYKNWDVVQLWNQFKSVEVMISIDGWGEQGELIRKGFDSEKFELNLRRILDEGKTLTRKMHITVSALNVFHIVNLLENLLSKGYLGQRQNQINDFDFGHVHHPKHYDINILNEDERSKVKELYLAFINKVKKQEPAIIAQMIEKQLMSVLSYFSSEQMKEERKKFKVATFTLDQLRDERTILLFPEHFNLLYENI